MKIGPGAKALRFHQFVALRINMGEFFGVFYRRAGALGLGQFFQEFAGQRVADFGLDVGELFRSGANLVAADEVNAEMGANRHADRCRPRGRCARTAPSTRIFLAELPKRPFPKLQTAPKDRDGGTEG